MQLISWQRVDPVTGEPPRSRSLHTMCYDYENKKYLVFGGQNSTGCAFDDDVYTLEMIKQDDREISAKWEVLTGTGESPGSIFGHSSVFTQGNMYIFGGQNIRGEYTNSLYQMNTRTGQWQKVNSTGTPPQPRSNHAMTAIQNRIYIFGGCCADGKFNDLHYFDIKTTQWHLLMPTSELKPMPRTGAGLLGMRNTNDDGDLLCLVFGCCEEPVSDIYTYSNKSHAWYTQSCRGDVPSPRSEFAASLLMAGKIFLFGGKCNPADDGSSSTEGFRNDSYVYSVLGGHWSKLKELNPDSVPSPRGCMVGIKVGLNGFLMYGGQDIKNTRLGDLWYATLEKK